MELFCPSCKGNDVSCMGKISKMDTFAGNILSSPLPQSSFLRCEKCNLYFRWPRLNKKERDKLYQSGSSENWQYELKQRKDWQLAISKIDKKAIKNSVLDIGCFNGKFLENLKGISNLYGVEINSVASNKAQDKGVKIIANNFSDIASLSIKFDIITAFDVIEHVENPLSFIASMGQVAKDNGLIIVSSGNTEAVTWKISRSRYWYCSIPEHISFINSAWCNFVADKLNLEIKHIERFSHIGKVGLIGKFLELTKNIIYLITPMLFRKLRKIKHRLYKNDTGNNYDYPPSWMTSKDHIVVIFKKKR